ncbi:ATP-dependent RNA helicase YejH [Photobacterium aphoticum]|uniref:ATP-dependent RNA helicase YejH n=1 Tax=Photobacterium aphoticum TaxID=754436 RepID=A0A090QT69_9GAMM|nr:ATP-dependent RNA helicase YejH [Photobacterium aphoticum]
MIDEFHHASAKTYLNILNYFTPTFLLGLTATPERTDQANILSLCHDNLVFERNLVHGIDEKILVPFHYFGIWDDAVDYQEIPWRNGKFDPQALDAQFATLRRAQHIFHHWKQHQQSRTLAFCVSKKHADFMADAFNEAFAEQGLKALAVHSDSPVRRNEALTLLDKGEVHVLFSVDLFNEGTDLPSIDTVMMLRPTESNIIFLQQLGRGLRRHESKAHLVVLDFIGNHRTFLNKQEVLGLSLGQRAASSALRSSSGEAPRLGAGCFVNLDPQIIAFWAQLSKQYRNTAEEDYLNLEGHLGHRPQAVEFYRAGYDLAKVSKQHKSWFGLVAQHCESDTTRSVIARHHDFLFNAVQKASMTKCFKAVLLEAFLELDGFQTPPTIEQLAARSWQVLSCYPRLRERDLKPKEQALLATDKQWVKYWHANPVNAFIGKNSKQADAWFRLEGEHFCANFEVLPSEAAILHDLVKELVDYLLARYTDRDSTPAMVSNQVTEQISNVTALEPLKTAAPEKAQVSLPYYPDLKIACGHFKTGHHDECELMAVDLMNVDPERHFLARASGNSMNGGKSPIYDGDLLLLELVTPTSAGSITGTTMAIEIQDESGDNQYLLRVVKKDKQGQYWLKANNPDYADMPANETMKTFARLKLVVR